MGEVVRIVGSMLVRDDDLWVERALRNVAGFCDRIHVLDHRSRDRTGEILRRLAGAWEHMEVVRSSDARRSHRMLAPYVGTRTWVLPVDGDELYDPAGLARLRADLLAGAHADAFRLRPWIVHCVALDEAAGTATGYLSPPSRVVGKLYNLAAVEAWPEGPERLHGNPVFREGFASSSVTELYALHAWEDDPLRFLHLCFMPRSSSDPEPGGERRNLGETGAYRRGVLARAARWARRPALSREYRDAAQRGVSWKRAKYARGDLVTVDARPFLAGTGRAAVAPVGGDPDRPPA